MLINQQAGKEPTSGQEANTSLLLYCLFRVSIYLNLFSRESVSIATMGAQWSQFFPPPPQFTSASIPSLSGKVFLITGGASGIGYELAKILYQKSACVYIAGRSEERALKAISEIRSTSPSATGGRLEFLHLRLDDLQSIKASVDTFKAKESKLHVLWNNAGVSRPPVGSVSKQGIELQLATNCLGPFLLTQLLLPLLQETASGLNPGSVRVVWTSSQVIELSAPKETLIMSEVRSPPADATKCYLNSKTGNFLLASELARRCGESHNGIISVATNPGAASTDLFRHTPSVRYLAWPLLHKPEMAALTQLYAGLSSDITAQTNGCYVIPWGRIHSNLGNNLLEATQLPDEGGSGRASEFWDFCVQMTSEYQ
ncbi:short-chain dehydrogenase [Nemania sp. FL0916]|nr:short-chain dehydrogenase [Nemania sp. FL0916]